MSVQNQNIQVQDNTISLDRKPQAATDPIPETAATKYRSWGGELWHPREENPQHKLTDIIPVVVTNVIASPFMESSTQENKQPTGLGKLFKGKQNETSKGKSTIKTVFMPRSEYLKYFATDDKGEYMGTEPKQDWTEEELEERFGEFRPAKNDGRDAGFMDRMLTASARGL